MSLGMCYFGNNSYVPIDDSDLLAGDRTNIEITVQIMQQPGDDLKT